MSDLFGNPEDRFSHDNKFPEFLTSENFAVISKKNKTKWPNYRAICPKDLDEMANREDPDQTAQTYLLENCGSFVAFISTKQLKEP